MRKIVFAVTNDLNYDQRMHRICNSLANAGFDVLLVGRKRSFSLPLQDKTFAQQRLRCFFNHGFLFYAEYNFRLLLFLLFTKTDAICAIDLDTILACWLASKLKGAERVYDAHEYFTEMVEMQQRRRVASVWLKIEKFAVRRFRNGYTVSEGLADRFKEKYGCEYQVIRNMPVLIPTEKEAHHEKILLYQGAVNEGRCFEYLIPAMRTIDYKLIVVGDGNFFEKLKALITEYQVEKKVELVGMVLPEQLSNYNRRASLGIGISQPEGANQYLALPNKFFDYIHAGLPQLTMNFPEYRKLNDRFEVAVLIDDIQPSSLAKSINAIMRDEVLLERLSKNCVKARSIFCWQSEEKRLIQFYKKFFQDA